MADSIIYSEQLFEELRTHGFVGSSFHELDSEVSARLQRLTDAVNGYAAAAIFEAERNAEDWKAEATDTEGRLEDKIEELSDARGRIDDLKRDLEAARTRIAKLEKAS